MEFENLYIHEIQDYVHNPMTFECDYYKPPFDDEKSESPIREERKPAKASLGEKQPTQLQKPTV